MYDLQSEIPGRLSQFLQFENPVFLPLGVLGEALESTGVGPSALWEMFATVVGSITCGTGCYALGVGIAAGLGPLGGLIFAAIQPE